jgi:autotransporter-associated beta strand protein
VTADSTIAYASVTSGLTDAADITNGAGPDGVVFEFTSNSVDTTGGTLTLRHNGLSQGLTYRPTFSGSGFNYTGPVVLSGAGTRKTVFQSSNTSGTQTWSGVISGTGSYARSGAGGTTVFTGANTFAGGVTVTAGTLTASGASATLGGGNVTVTGGNIAIDNASANAIANSATLSLAGGGAAGVADVAFANLVAGLNDTIAGLILAGNTLGAGTYGSSTSGAANPGLAGLGLNPNEFFSGNGIVTVVLPGLPGDFNSDGKVDAGDYVTWRKNNGTNNALANDGGLGTPVGTNHYNLWRANFGNPPGAGSGGGLSAGEVPEPGTLVLLVCAVGSCLTMASRARCRRRG